MGKATYLMVGVIGTIVGMRLLQKMLVPEETLTISAPSTAHRNVSFNVSGVLTRNGIPAAGEKIYMFLTSGNRVLLDGYDITPQPTLTSDDGAYQGVCSMHDTMVDGTYGMVAVVEDQLGEVF